MSKISGQTDSEDKTLEAAKARIANAVERRTDKSNAISSKSLAGIVGVKPTTVRDLIQEVRREYAIPIVSCSKGYYTLDSTDALERELASIQDEIETRQQTKQELVRAFNQTNA